MKSDLIRFIELAWCNDIINDDDRDKLITFAKEHKELVYDDIYNIHDYSDIMTFSEAAEKYNLSTSTLRRAMDEGRLLDNEYRKSAGTLLVIECAMKRLYGDYKGRAKYNRRKKGSNENTNKK